MDPVSDIRRYLTVGNNNRVPTSPPRRNCGCYVSCSCWFVISVRMQYNEVMFRLLQGCTRRTMHRDVWSAGGRDGGSGGGESWRRWWTRLGGLLAMGMAMSCLVSTIPSAEANPDAKRLYDDLLSNYNRLIRPVGNNSDRLTVKMGLRLSQLIDVVSISYERFHCTAANYFTRFIYHLSLSKWIEPPAEINSIPKIEDEMKRETTQLRKLKRD